MIPQQTDPPRPQKRRADAQRNIDRIVTAAQLLLEQRGASVALDEVAREAGVSSATLYRHFPSRMHLLERLYEERMEGLVAVAADLSATHEPLEALITWLYELLGLTTEARGVLTVLISEGLRESDPARNAEAAYHLLVRAVSDLITRAQAAGEIRSDVDAADLVRLFSGIIRATEMPPVISSQADRVALAERLLRVLLSGLMAEVPGTSEAGSGAVKSRS